MTQGSIAMKVNHWSRARNFSKVYKSAEGPLAQFKKAVIEANWKNPADVEKTFATVSRYKDALIFNIGGNKFRLIAICRFELGRLYIDKVMTHEEYGKNQWRERYDKKAKSKTE